MLLPLHLAIHDKNKKSLVVEFVGGTMQIYDNPYNVMTNDPPFPGQIKNLEKYQQLANSPDGLIGLPGDPLPSQPLRPDLYFEPVCAEIKKYPGSN